MGKSLLQQIHGAAPTAEPHSWVANPEEFEKEFSKVHEKESAAARNAPIPQGDLQKLAQELHQDMYEMQNQASSWSPLAFGAALGLAAAVLTANAPAASAADAENGSAIFGANCTACHAGGKNNVKAEKTLPRCPEGEQQVRGRRHDQLDHRGRQRHASLRRAPGP